MRGSPRTSVLEGIQREDELARGWRGQDPLMAPLAVQLCRSKTMWHGASKLCQLLPELLVACNPVWLEEIRADEIVPLLAPVLSCVCEDLARFEAEGIVRSTPKDFLVIEALRVIRLLSPLAIEPLAHLIALLMFDYRYRLDSGRRLLAVEALGRVNPDCREQYAEMLARIIQPSDESTDVMLGALRAMSDLRPATIARHEEHCPQDAICKRVASQLQK